MLKRYLEPGESVRIFFMGRVGLSGTLIDMQADVKEMIDANGNAPLGPCGNSIGTIVRGSYTSDVFVEVETGKLWHNEDDGWY